jgi:hypothetical protein
MRIFRLVVTFAILHATPVAWGLAGGTLSGTLKDRSDAVIEAAKLTLTNTAVRSQFEAQTDARGYYSFPSLTAGHYDLTIAAKGFKPEQRSNLAIDSDAAVRLDVVLEVAVQTQTVTVADAVASVGTQVETTATHLGEVVPSAQIEALPLNGRAYTDLLAIQPGVSPVTTLTPTSVIMAGVTGTINPSGDLNPGDVSIDGQRESANGFTVNGIDVQEHMNGGTSVIPNLDSIEEFRVLTNNFDPEYGNYNGGMINVVSKSGSNSVPAKLSTFCEIPISTPGTFSIILAAHFAKTSSAGCWEARSEKTRCFSSPIIKGRNWWRASVLQSLPCLRCRIGRVTLWM